ncbi:hypothetical protein [Natrinema pallidum]|uniref:hypothetical protein n=1 Tax=Natrinema pallidum TaxID=69527 RepID=UPI003751BF0A
MAGEPDANAMFGGGAALFAMMCAAAMTADPEVPVLVAFLAVAASATLGAYALACTWMPKNVGKGRTRASQFKRTLAKYCGYHVRDCGCTYSDRYALGGHSKPDSTTVESNEIYVRREDDARVIFDLTERGLRRCHRCGSHYHFERSVTAYDRSDRIECWPEEEPDVVDTLDQEVVSEEVTLDAE